MTVSSHYTFIQCESGPNPRQIGLIKGKKIRAQVMRMSWSHKKASRKNHTPTHKSPDIPLCHSLVENRQYCTASTFRSIITTGSTNAKVGSVLEQRTTRPLPQNDVPVHARSTVIVSRLWRSFTRICWTWAALWG